MYITKTIGGNGSGKCTNEQQNGARK